jgi:hypothetical protein
MKQIKTITRASASEFDEAVNAALVDGWQLIERKLAQTPAGTPDYHYAQLEREVITEAERCCENCAHYFKEQGDEPCRSCSEDCDKWESEGRTWRPAT